jgi:carbonic anhydrase
MLKKYATIWLSSFVAGNRPMKPRFVAILFFLTLFVMPVLVTAQEPPVHWEYEGEAGPEHWGELDESYAACSQGRAQSPIDVVDPAVLNLTDIHFDYHPSAMTIFNNAGLSLEGGSQGVKTPC